MNALADRPLVLRRRLAAEERLLESWLRWIVRADSLGNDALVRQQLADRVIDLALARAVLDEALRDREPVALDRAEARIASAERSLRTAIEASAWDGAAAAIGELDPRSLALHDTAEIDLGAWVTFCRDVVAPAARETDRTGQVAPEIWRGIREHGYLRLFGARDVGPLFVAMQALAVACASTFWRATISAALGAQMVHELASPDVRRRYHGPLVDGEIVGAFATTEVGSGSDPTSYRSRLRRLRGSWVLEGEKRRVSNAVDARVAAVLCNAVTEAGEALGLALAFVDLERSGVVRAKVDSLGLRGMGWGSLTFRYVEVADEEVTLVKMPQIMHVVEWGQLVQSICGVGLGLAALDEAETFLAGRTSFGQSLASSAVVRDKLDRARADVDAGATMARQVLEDKVRGIRASERIFMTKVFCTEAGARACEAALRVCGAAGYSTDLAIERYFRDAQGNIPAGLPNDRLRELIIAPRLGLDPWRR